MRVFGDTVSTRVVPRYPDVSDVVPLLQVGERFHKHRPVVGDDFAKSTPSAQDVFEDPISNGLHGLCVEGMIFGEMRQGAAALYEVLEAARLWEVHGVHVHLGKQRSRSSDYQRNEDVTGLAKLAYVAGPYEPCDVGGEVRPPKVVNDVCSCGEVSVMSSGEICWSFVAVNDYFMTTLRIPSPKTAIDLEKVFGVPQEGGICIIGKSRRMFGSLEPFANALQMVIGAVGSLRLGEKVIGEWWFVSDGIGNVCRGSSWAWELRFERVEKMHEPIDLVNPIVELQVFRGFSIFIGRLFQSSGEAVGAMSSTGDMNEGKVEQKD